MTNQEIIIEIAKLDGWTVAEFCPQDIDGPEIYQGKLYGVWRELPPYLTSRDAIVLVIEKQSFEIQVKVYKKLDEIVGHVSRSLSHHRVLMITSSASQLCEALLRATGKWKE